MLDVVDPRAPGPLDVVEKPEGQSEGEVDSGYPGAFFSKGILELDERRKGKDFINSQDLAVKLGLGQGDGFPPAGDTCEVDSADTRHAAIVARAPTSHQPPTTS